MNMNIVAGNDEEFTEMYDFLFCHYKDSQDDEIIRLWIIHQKSHSYINDFHSIGCRVCEDILRLRGNSYIDDVYYRR